MLAVLAKALPGDTITLSWRFKPVDPLADIQVDSSWATWCGTVVAPIDGFSIIVDWDSKAPRLQGKRRRYFPDVAEWPDSECDYSIPMLQRSAAKAPRREPPGTPPPAKQAVPAMPPQQQQPKPATLRPERSETSGAQIVMSEAQFKKLMAAKRERESSDDESSSDEERYDRSAGANVPMRNVVDGLRIPKNPDAASTAWYPHLWQNGDVWAIAVRAKLSEFSCNIKSLRIKKDIDLDIDVISELIDRRLTEGEDVSLKQHRCTFAVMARIISNILLTSSMASLSASELFLTAFNKALDNGRVDFAMLINNRLLPSDAKNTAPAVAETAAAATPAQTNTGLRSDDVAYWKGVAEEAHRQLDRSSFRGRGRGFRQGKNNKWRRSS